MSTAPGLGPNNGTGQQHNPEGLYRHLDGLLKMPATVGAIRWLGQHKLPRFHRRVADYVLEETLPRRRAFAPIAYSQFVSGLGMKPGPCTRMKLDPVLARLQQDGILRSEPGQSDGRGGRPPKLWRLGYVDEVLATDSVAQTSQATEQEVSATEPPEVLATEPEEVSATGPVASSPHGDSQREPTNDDPTVPSGVSTPDVTLGTQRQEQDSREKNGDDGSHQEPLGEQNHSEPKAPPEDLVARLQHGEITPEEFITHPAWLAMSGAERTAWLFVVPDDLFNRMPLGAIKSEPATAGVR
jgi:hypothetical protein